MQTIPPQSMTQFKTFTQTLPPVIIALGILAPGGSAGAERINHEGRILGPEPVVTEPVLFNTPEADAIISALQIFPSDNAWNEDISQRPVHSNSANIINTISSELLSSRRTLRAFYEMNFVLVPDDQPTVPIEFIYYPDESDPSPYPIPANMPVESWPQHYGNLTLEQWQEDINGEGGDRHSIIIQPGTGGLWETWLTKRIGTDWQAANGAKFDINSNALRPDGWTSGDAAGLSMLGGLVRYDECERGMVEHAIRIIVKHTRREYIYPATHHASVPSTTDPNVPAMGQRLRLKSSFVIPENWTIHEKSVLRALKKYGAIVADNGNFFSISVAPDDRFPDEAFDNLRSVGISEFEVIETTGPNEGPRSPGAPTALAGSDVTIGVDKLIALEGFVDAPTPATIEWNLYSGPDAPILDDTSKTNAMVSFPSTGTYTLMLSADDGVHAVAYDAVVVTVTDEIRVTASRDGTSIRLSWSGGTGPFDVESAPGIPVKNWDFLESTSDNSASIPIGTGNRVFRVKEQ